MLSWFPAQVKTHGLLSATRLLWRVIRYRVPVGLSNKLLRHKVECPCCGWKGHRFFDYIETGFHVPNSACPNCDSHSRHRALYLWLKNDFHIESKSGRALIIAPERSLAALWQSARNLRTIKTDIETTRGVDLLADVMRLPFANESVELIWCHHVLEQVENDRIGLSELHRILQPITGQLLVSVGQTGHEKTQEFGRADKSLCGNWRLYGSDFIKRLQETGFKVEPMKYGLKAEEYGLYAVYPEIFYCCTKLDASS